MATPFTLTAFQGIGLAFTAQVRYEDGTNVVNVYTGAETLSGYVWPGNNQPAVFALTPTWLSGPLGLITATIDGATTATVPPGIYELIVQRADSSQALVYGYIDLQPTPGTNPTDLVTVPYVRASLTEVVLSEDQVAQLPYTILSACKFIKRFCGDRDFIRQTYVKEYIPSQDGIVRLEQIPVNQILRVQGGRTTALTIQQPDQSVSASWVAWSYTGDYDTGIVPTGLTFNSQSNGVLTTQPMFFSVLPSQTIGSLITAIGGLTFPTWLASTCGYSNWPVSELIGGEIAQGASGGSGVSLDVYGVDLQNCRLQSQGTGMLYVGYNNDSLSFGPRWGPGWQDLDYAGVGPCAGGKVKVTYNAGYTTVPHDVQFAAAELTKYMIDRMKTDGSLEKERVGDYEYVLRKIWPGMPDSVKQVISLYRQHYA